MEIEVNTENLEAGGNAPTSTDNAPTEGRPGWLPEQFQTGEDMLASYQSLQAEYTKLKQGPQEGAPAGEQSDAATTPPPPSGNPIQDATNEWEATGVLADTTYSKLEAVGIDRAMVDQYINGQTATATAATNRMMDVVGGAAAYTEMGNWMRSNLSVDEVESYNDVVQGDNPAATEFAIRAMSARMRGDAEPGLIQGNKTGSRAAGDVFRSQNEVVAAMRDKRYREDPAYQQDVQSKLARSNLFG